MDPPPIVELKIYQDQAEGKENDITYNMNANYFLFATLEQARPIAQPRGSEDKNRLTVLTGTPVAGMVYLDRPTPAGYFIFPDLSVRHEGVYRLSFSLYEELKDSKDDDKTDDASRAGTPGDAHVTHRLEVKSQPFVVFSAKKFPGLTESTSLSRMVAEQGCRVRIRRDVRMRRRDTKSGGKDWDDYEDDTAQARARMSATPEGSGYPTLPTPHGFGDPITRPRSASNASHQSLANPLSRRTSTQELNQSYHQPYGNAPHTPQNAFGQSSPYGPSPSQQFSQPPYMQQQPAMQPPPPQYHSQAYPPPPPMPAPAPPQQSYYGYAAAPPSASVPQPQYPPPAEPASQHQRMSVDYSGHVQADQRRSSTQYSAPTMPQSNFAQHASAPSYSSYPPAQQSYQPPPPPPQQPMYQSHHGQQQNYASQDSYSRPPPLQPVQPPARATGATTPLPAPGRSSFERRSVAALPPLQMPANMASKLEPSSPATAMPPSSYYPSATTPVDAHKRSYGSVFNDRHLSQPLRQGARPGTPGYGQPTTYASISNSYPEADDGDGSEGEFHSAINHEMKYRRADGRPITRHLNGSS